MSGVASDSQIHHWHPDSGRTDKTRQTRLVLHCHLQKELVPLQPRRTCTHTVWTRLPMDSPHRSEVPRYTTPGSDGRIVRELSGSRYILPERKMARYLRPLGRSTHSCDKRAGRSKLHVEGLQHPCPNCCGTVTSTLHGIGEKLEKSEKYDPHFGPPTSLQQFTHGTTHYAPITSHVESGLRGSAH